MRIANHAALRAFLGLLSALVVGCGGGGSLAAAEVQVEGKARMRAADFANGYRPAPGERLGA